MLLHCYYIKFGKHKVILIMIDASCLFDSDEEDEKTKTPEQRQFLFRKELKSMLYGFGDDKV